MHQLSSAGLPSPQCIANHHPPEMLPYTAEGDSAVTHKSKNLKFTSLHSWVSDASFDTHIAISRHCKCWVPNAPFLAKMPKMPYLTPMPSDMYHMIYGNMGVKRCVRTSGMKTNAIKQLSKKFNGSKFQNTDFQNFPLYFLKFPLYNVQDLGRHFPCSLRFEILHVILYMVEEWDKLRC